MLASLVIRERRTKTRGHPLTSARLAILKTWINDRCQGGCGETGIFIHCWPEYKIIQLLWKTVWHFIKNVNTIMTQHVPLFLDIYSGEVKTHVPVKNYTWIFTIAWLILATSGSSPSADEWINKTWCIFTPLSPLSPLSSPPCHETSSPCLPIPLSEASGKIL